LIDKVKDDVHMTDIFLKLLLAMNYFDSAIGNCILSVHYQIRGGWFCRNL